jgi:ADP-heptose:LPS heptosyltransferase
VISAAAKDAGIAERIRKMMASKPIIVAGRISFKQLGALLERASVVVANDTGPMHVAVAIGARTIALFGPTSPMLTGPYGKGDYRVISRNNFCEIPCYNVACADNICMSAIKVEDVLDEVRRMLEKR